VNELSANNAAKPRFSGAKRYEVRYPGGLDVTPEEAQRVLKLANKVKNVVEQWFENNRSQPRI